MPNEYNPSDVSEEYMANYDEVQSDEGMPDNDKSLILDYGLYLQNQQKNQWAGAAAAAPQYQSEEYPEREEDEKTGMWNDVWEGIKEAPKQAFAGAVDAVDEAMESVDDLWDWGAANFEMLQKAHDAIPDLPSIPDDAGWRPDPAKTMTGGIVRAGAQFLTGFIPALKGAKLVGMGAKVAPYVAGVAADMAVFDPLEGRLSNMIEEIPALQNPVTEYLAADGDDTAVEGRFKNALEGLALGGVSDGIFRAIKSFKKFKGSGLADDAVKNTDEAIKAEEIKISEAKLSGENVEGIAAGEMKAGDIDKKYALGFNPSDAEVKTFQKQIKSGEKVDIQESLGTNLEYVVDDDGMKKAIQMSESAAGETLTRARNKPMTWESAEAKAFAAELGQPVELLAKTYGDLQNLDAKVLSGRMLVESSGKKMDDLIKAFEANESVENAARVSEYFRTHVRLQSTLAGTASNMARGLNIMKKVEKGIWSAEDMDMMLKSRGGVEATKETIKRMRSISDKTQANKFLKTSLGAKSQDAIFYYWINSILSGPQTHVVNIMSNAAASVADLGDTFMAGTANLFRKGGDVTVREAGYKALGMLHGVYDALKISRGIMKMSTKKLMKGDFKGFNTTIKDSSELGTMWKAGITDTAVLDPLTKFEHSVPGISGPAFGKSGKAGKVADFLGSVIGMPGRALMTFDEMFKAINYRGELYALSAREGIGNGLKGKALGKHIKGAAYDPKMSHWKQAIGKARELTFQEQLGTKGKSLQHFIGNNPMLRFAAPFIRTPVNLLKYVGRRTPGIHKLSQKMKADIAAGGARKELAMSKLAMGTSMYGIASLMAAQGLITGHANREQRAANKWINKQEVSMKLGDTWYSFDRSDPFGMFFGLVADIVDLGPQIKDGDLSELSSALITVTSENLVNKTYLRGVSDIFMAVSEPERRMAKWHQNFIGSFIPNFLAQETKMGLFGDADMQRKEIETLRDKIVSRLPWASEGLYPKRNRITGEEMLYGEGIAGGIIPFYQQEESDDPVMRKAHEIGFNPRDLQKTLADGQIPLSPKQYDDYQKKVTSTKLNGLTLHETLAKLVKMDKFNSLPIGEAGDSKSQKGIFHKVINQFGKQGKMELYADYPALFELLKASKGIK